VAVLEQFLKVVHGGLEGGWQRRVRAKVVVRLHQHVVLVARLFVGLALDHVGHHRLVAVSLQVRHRGRHGRHARAVKRPVGRLGDARARRSVSVVIMALLLLLGVLLLLLLAHGLEGLADGITQRILAHLLKVVQGLLQGDRELVLVAGVVRHQHCLEGLDALVR